MAFQISLGNTPNAPNAHSNAPNFHGNALDAHGNAPNAHGNAPNTPCNAPNHVVHRGHTVQAIQASHYCHAGVGISKAHRIIHSKSLSL